MKTDEQLLEELAAAVEGLLLMSETDAPLEPVWLEDEDLADVSETRGFEEFFDRATFVVLKPAGGAEKAGADRVEKLKRALADNLEDLRVYRVGSISIAVYVVGRSAAGSLLGLSTRVVET